MTANYLPHYINGQWITPTDKHDGCQSECIAINPATEAPIAKMLSATQAQVDSAVHAAQNAFEHWAETDPMQRMALLKKLLALYQKDYELMAQTISKEMGAPIDFARSDQADCGQGHIQATLDALENFAFEQLLGPTAILKEPVGVCGLITPWNWPINQIACKVAPALAAGCCVVLKPSELTPLSAQLFCQMIDQAGFPPGVFNLLHGTGPETGALLSRHPGVDMVSFTGSTRAGIEVSKTAANTIKRVTLELGGKSPCIVFADADLDKAILKTVAHCMENTGQSCNAPTRLLVERSIYDKAVTLAAQAAQSTPVGYPDQSGDFIGPLVSANQYARVQQLMTDALEEGAKLVAGGLGKPEGFEKGFFTRPTVFADVNNAMQIAQTEIFGPVLCIIPFDSEQEAIAIANDTPYGLAAYVHTKDANKARRVTKKLRAGMVRINHAAHPYSAPFGGYKQSGNGREWGIYGLEDYLETKAVSI